MKQGLSKQQILEIASRKMFVVHRYAWSQAGLRKKVRRMLRDGLLRQVDGGRDHFGYRAI